MLRIYRAFNEWLALKVTLMVGTMECVYAFAGLAAVPLFMPALEGQVQFVSSSFLQLVLLPMIMVGNLILSRASEVRAKQDHETLFELLKLAREEVAELREVLARLSHPAACEAAPAA